jgi:hypothetical protein
MSLRRVTGMIADAKPTPAGILIVIRERLVYNNHDPSGGADYKALTDIPSGEFYVKIILKFVRGRKEHPHVTEILIFPVSPG